MVVGATGLSTAGGGAAAAGAPDSRVVLICGADQTNDTRVVYNSCEPQWNERIQMVLPTDGSVDRLIAMVFDTRQVNDDDEPTPLGFCFITFDSLHDLEGYDDRVWPLARTEAEAKQVEIWQRTFRTETIYKISPLNALCIRMQVMYDVFVLRRGCMS